MDKAVERLLEQSKNGTALTRYDWKILLQEASDDSSLDGVLVACYKLNLKPPIEILDNLLLTSICRGNCDIALRTSAELSRKLTTDENNLLVEAAILSGNVEGLCEYIQITNTYTQSLLHTSAAIAVALQTRKRKGVALPLRVNLKTWPLTYCADLSRFNLVVETLTEVKHPIAAQFCIFDKYSLSKLIGALLTDNTISKESAEKLLEANF